MFHLFCPRLELRVRGQDEDEIRSMLRWATKVTDYAFCPARKKNSREPYNKSFIDQACSAVME